MSCNAKGVTKRFLCSLIPQWLGVSSLIPQFLETGIKKLGTYREYGRMKCRRKNSLGYVYKLEISIRDYGLGEADSAVLTKVSPRRRYCKNSANYRTRYLLFAVIF